jgi:hypothetical protein
MIQIKNLPRCAWPDGTWPRAYARLVRLGYCQIIWDIPHIDGSAVAWLAPAFDGGALH